VLPDPQAWRRAALIYGQGQKRLPMAVFFCAYSQYQSGYRSSAHGFEGFSA
jgi:hypothetical protein